MKGRSGRYRLAEEEKGSEEDDNCDFIIKKLIKEDENQHNIE